jgi:cell wall-associated NlpC family hydrolase
VDDRRWEGGDDRRSGHDDDGSDVRGDGGVDGAGEERAVVDQRVEFVAAAPEAATGTGGEDDSDEIHRVGATRAGVDCCDFVTIGSRAIMSGRGRSLVRFAVALVATVGAVATGASVSAGPPVPREIGGDHHSVVVAGRAAEALVSYDHFRAQANTTRMIRFIGDRNAAADAVAGEFGLEPAAVRGAWARAGFQRQVAVLAALSQLGVPYRSNTSEPGVSFDCSGLTAYAWGRAGVPLYRQSGVQISDAAPRTQETAQAGDLVQYPGHVMMYLGVDGAIVHAANSQSDVELSTLRDRSYSFGDPTA